MKTPWYKSTFRWSQTNLTEIDARDCDVEWWRSFWRKNNIQGIIVNAGGIIAYYPSKNPLQYRSKYLGERDLLREFVDAARQDGITVLARMDINRATEECYRAHPDWFATDKEGNPYRAASRYVSCVNSGYYKEYIPEVLREIIHEYRPDGITDNSWWGASAKQICYCQACRDGFHAYSGLSLPEQPDWEDKVYRQWIKWSIQCRNKNWELFNRVTTEEGGEDCLWMGMLNANPMSSHGNLCDLRTIGEKYDKVLMTDHQCREEIGGFEQNGLNGLLFHSIAGEDALVPESMANYNRGRYFIRRAANPALETRTWMLEGISGGISPWTHFIGSTQDDRRMFDTCTPVMKWHNENKQYLYGRKLVARVGLAWSQDNVNFYGKNNAAAVCELPWRGFNRALTRARIPYFPINCHHIERDAEKMDVLILPDLAVLTDEQIRQIEIYYKMGKSLVFTGATGMLDNLGYVREEFPLDKLTGMERLDRELKEVTLSDSYSFHTIDRYDMHNYMRLPEGQNHPILSSYEDTDIIAISGQLYHVRPHTDALKVLANYIPAFPTYPPEISYMEDAMRTSDIPVIIAGKSPYGGRVVYLAADIDRRYAHAAIPDHGNLLANIVSWAAGTPPAFRVEGPGYLDCKLYGQPDRLVFHINNLSGLNQWPGYVEEYYPAGALVCELQTGGRRVSRVEARVAGGQIDFEQSSPDAVRFHLNQIVDHELVVVEFV